MLPYLLIYFFRWANLKEALIEKRKELGESQTLQQFSRDADEIENWMLEKLQLAEEKIEIDNIQSKHKKHQAFEAELGIIKHTIHKYILRRSF